MGFRLQLHQPSLQSQCPTAREPSSRWKAGYVKVVNPGAGPFMAEIVPCSLCLCLCTQGVLDSCKSCCVSRGPVEPDSGNEVPTCLMSTPS